MTANEYGEIAYNAYCASTGGRSLISGDVLPGWGKLGPDIQKAWERAASAVCSAAFRGRSE